MSLCCICFEPIITPIILNCNHILCVHCINNIIDISGNINIVSCPLCRGVARISKMTLPKYEMLAHYPLWLYRGRNIGWWMYDHLISSRLETAYQSMLTTDVNALVHDDYLIHVAIGVRKYVVDIRLMVQTLHNSNGVSRDVKRIGCHVDHLTQHEGLMIKGISGIPVTDVPDVFNLSPPSRERLLSDSS